MKIVDRNMGTSLWQTHNCELILTDETQKKRKNTMKNNTCVE
jgi:hypothetical protein